MRVALSVEALSPRLTGIGRYTLELARRLRADNAIEDVLFFCNETLVGDPELLLFEQARTTLKRPRIRPPRWLRKRQTAWQLHRQMKGRLFHGPNYFLPSSVASGIITVHDLSVFHFPETHPIERLRHFEKEFTSSLDRAAHIITDSQTVRHELMAHSAIAPERITAVSLGVSPTFKQHSMAELRQPLEKYGLEKSSYILCVSTIEPRKKIRELLNAWRALPSSVRSKIRLVVAGGGGWLNSELLEELQGGMDGSVQYLGYVPEKELPALYAGAALFVYPSSYEGFGLPPVEAMASGVPVIVSNRSCLPEVTKGVAMVIDPDDIDAFALALQQGLTDQPWRAQAVAEGLEVASSYTWDRCAIQTRDVYQKVFDGRE